MIIFKRISTKVSTKWAHSIFHWASKNGVQSFDFIGPDGINLVGRSEVGMF